MADMEKDDKQLTQGTAPKDESSVGEGVESRGTVVGLSTTKKIVIGAAIIAGVFAILYFILLKPSDEERAKRERAVKPKKEEIERALKEANNAPLITADEERPDLPMQLPELPELSIPEPPKPPPPPPSEQGDEGFNPFDFQKKSGKRQKDKAEEKAPAPKPDEGEERPRVTMPIPPLPAPTSVSPVAVESSLNSKQKIERRAGNMIAFGGAKKTGEKEDRKVNVAISSPLERTGAAQIKNSYYGDKTYMITQGKMIEIVLETAINTDLKGLLRGVVSRDIYAESGRHILIPRGSRAIGTYSASLEDGQSRVAVVWTRILRPDGIDIVLDMPATDQLGRSGISGEVDYHFPEIMRNSLLISLLTIASGVITDQIFNDNLVTETVDTTTGAVTTSSSAAHSETQGVMNDILEDLRDSLDKTEKSTQTITVNAGTVMKAFVRQDIVFVGDTAFRYSE